MNSHLHSSTQDALLLLTAAAAVCMCDVRVHSHWIPDFSHSQFDRHRNNKKNRLFISLRMKINRRARAVPIANTDGTSFHSHSLDLWCCFYFSCANFTHLLTQPQWIIAECNPLDDRTRFSSADCFRSVFFFLSSSINGSLSIGNHTARVKRSLTAKSKSIQFTSRTCRPDHKVDQWNRFNWIVSNTQAHTHTECNRLKSI